MRDSTVKGTMREGWKKSPTFSVHNELKGEMKALDEYSFHNDQKNWDLYGYYFHMSLDREDRQKTDYHTHGILHSRGKPDLKITDLIDPFIASAIFRELIARMDLGLVIRLGQEFDDILPGLTMVITESVDEPDVFKISLTETSLAD